MKVIEPGHIYELNQLDGNGDPLRLTFVNREAGTEHEGTQTQEVLRMQIDMIETLIDRTNHCDACLRWEGNDKIVKSLAEAQRQLRLALLFHEQRAMERKMVKDGWKPEEAATGKDGHIRLAYTDKAGCPLCEERSEGIHHELRSGISHRAGWTGDDKRIWQREDIPANAASYPPSF